MIHDTVIQPQIIHATIGAIMRRLEVIRPLGGEIRVREAALMVVEGEVAAVELDLLVAQLLVALEVLADFALEDLRVALEEVVDYGGARDAFGDVEGVEFQAVLVVVGDAEVAA